MHFYRFHVGDYLSHTHHLSPMEDLAYRKMLDYAYLHESGLPGDAATIARLVGLRGHETEVASVLSDFWFCEDGVWKNNRVEKELALMADKQAKAAAAGRASANARSTGAQRTFSGRSTGVEQSSIERSTTQDSKTPRLQEPSTEGGAARLGLVTKMVAKPDEVPDDLWSEWLAFRRRKNAPVTQRVLDSTRKTAAEAGMTMAEALTYWIANGQTGFFPPKGKPALRQTGAVVSGLRVVHPANMPVPYDSPIDPCHCGACVGARKRKENA